LSRIVNLLFALVLLVLLVALVIALDPQARRKAVEAVQSWQPALKQMDEKVVVNIPSISTPGPASIPLPAVTAVAENNEQIPVTGDNDTSNEPIIQINWDALGNALRDFWVRLSQVKIEFKPTHPKESK
jgi:hypothetical protein